MLSEKKAEVENTEEGLQRSKSMADRNKQNALRTIWFSASLEMFPRLSRHVRGRMRFFAQNRSLYSNIVMRPTF
jgi:hypothetical protein